MELNKWEKEFKEKLNSREIKPSETAWEKLDAMLAVDEEKPKRSFRWLYIAASIFGFLLVGTIYFSRLKTVEINNEEPIVLEQKSNVNNLDKSKISSEDILYEQNQEKVTKKQTVVAFSNDSKKQLNKLKNKEELSNINYLKEDSTVVNSSEDKNYQSAAGNKYISAEKLLAEVSNTKFDPKTTDKTIEQNKKGFSVNPNDLLLNAETELNQSYRESALDRFNKKLNAVKTVLVNRNYEE